MAPSSVAISSRTASAPASAPHVDDLSAREANLEPADDRAPERERERRPDRSLRQPAVRRRVDLLGRHVDEVGDPVDGLLGRGQPAVPLRRARRVRSVPGPTKRIARNRRSSSAAARSRSRSMCRCHAATGSGSSRRVAVITASHRRSTSGSPKTALRPALVRVADDRPLDEPPVLRVEQFLRCRAARASAVRGAGRDRRGARARLRP